MTEWAWCILGKWRHFTFTDRAPNRCLFVVRNRCFRSGELSNWFLVNISIVFQIFCVDQQAPFVIWWFINAEITWWTGHAGASPGIILSCSVRWTGSWGLRLGYWPCYNHIPTVKYYKIFSSILPASLICWTVQVCGKSNREISRITWFEWVEKHMSFQFLLLPSQSREKSMMIWMSLSVPPKSQCLFSHWLHFPPRPCTQEFHHGWSITLGFT